MALWGNNDNLVSSGTVALNYDTKVVTGSGTTFGTTGFGEVGDVIRFGARGGGGTYYGEAIISKVTSATNITIASTDGLSGAAIGGIIGLDVLFFGELSGASMNPIRSLAPAIISGSPDYLWLYWTTPFTGTMLVAVVYNLLSRRKKSTNTH